MKKKITVKKVKKSAKMNIAKDNRPLNGRDIFVVYGD